MTDDPNSARIPFLSVEAAKRLGTAHGVPLSQRDAAQSENASRFASAPRASAAATSLSTPSVGCVAAATAAASVRSASRPPVRDTRSRARA